MDMKQRAVCDCICTHYAYYTSGDGHTEVVFTPVACHSSDASCVAVGKGSLLAVYKEDSEGTKEQ